MKKKLALLLSALVAVILMVPNANAISLNIDVGDHGFYYGVPSYWDSGYEYIWVGGHREHGHWVHGYYRRNGEFHREHAGEHFRHDHH